MLKLALAYRNAAPGSPASGDPARARTPSSRASGPCASEASKAVSFEAMPLDLMEQVADGDGRRAGVVQREPGQVGLHRLIQPQPAGLDLLHHGDGGEGLAGGGQQHRRLRGHRPPGVVRPAEGGGVHLHPVLHDGDSGARNSEGLDLLLQVGVQFRVGLRGTRGSGGRRSGR